MIDIRAIIARAEKGEATFRDGAAILDRMQQEVEYLQELQDALPPADLRIVTRIDGDAKLFRFSGVDALANWLTGGTHGE